MFPSRIQGQNDTGSRILDPDPQQKIEIYQYLTPIIVTKLVELWSGMFIVDPGSGFFPSRIPDPGVKKHRIPDLDPHHWIPDPRSASLIGKYKRCFPK
jgi:hypothetical protein